MGFGKIRADVSCVSTFGNSIGLHIQLDVINLTKCKSSSFNYKFDFGKPGLTEFYYPYFAKPCSLAGIFNETVLNIYDNYLVHFSLLFLAYAKLKT